MQKITVEKSIMKVVDNEMIIGKAGRKRNRGIMYSLLAVGAGVAAYGVTRGMLKKEIDIKNNSSWTPDNPEIFNYDY